MSTLPQKILALRTKITSPTLDSLERMLNASKGAGTTTALVDQAKRLNIPLIVHSEKWATDLMSSNPGLRAKTFSAGIGGERVLIDNGVNWLLLREAQGFRKMTEELLNILEKEKGIK